MVAALVALLSCVMGQLSTEPASHALSLCIWTTPIACFEGFSLLCPLRLPSMETGLRYYCTLVDADEFDDTGINTKSTGFLDTVLRRRLLAALAVSLDWVSGAELGDDEPMMLRASMSLYRCRYDHDADLAALWLFHWTSAVGMDSVTEQEASLCIHAVVVSERLDTTDVFCTW